METKSLRILDEKTAIELEKIKEQELMGENRSMNYIINQILIRGLEAFKATK